MYDRGDTPRPIVADVVGAECEPGGYDRSCVPGGVVNGCEDGAMLWMYELSDQ